METTLKSTFKKGGVVETAKRKPKQNKNETTLITQTRFPQIIASASATMST